MAVHPEPRHHPIRVLHALGCLAIAGWFSGYAWQNHPARVAFRVQASSPEREVHHKKQVLPPSVLLPKELSTRFALVRSALPDVLGGVGVLLLFSLGTGIYARRFEVWLEAHQAGEAAAIRGVGLDRAALGANKDRKRGAVL